MKINLTYYKEDINYNTGKYESKVIDYINENKIENYNQIIENDNVDEAVLALSSIRENLVHACDIKTNSTVLEIGAHLGELTGALCKKSTKVVTIESNKKRAEAIAKRYDEVENLEIFVGNPKDIELKEKFDYITLFGVLEYATCFWNTEEPARDMIEFCKGLLKENGKILIATNNKFSMKSYVGDTDECTNNAFDSITGYKNSKKEYKLGKNKIEEILKKCNLNHYKFLYLLPDYKLPNIIFSDEYLPSSSKINGYFPYYRDCSSIFFSEVDAFDNVIKENKEMFKFFANSYLIKVSQNEFEDDTKFISFNNYRKRKYRLMTKIKSETVEKTCTNNESEEHIKNIAKNINDLKNENIYILDKYEEEKIISKFENSKLVSQMISDNLDNKKYIVDLFKKYKNKILELSSEYQENQNNVFEKYDINVEKEKINSFRYLKNGYWDLIFKNCFIINDEFVFFDQEWMEEYLPVDFLVYRCVVNIEKLRSKIDKYNLFEELGIQENIELFKELDDKISKEIFDEKIFALYTKKHENPIYDNQNLKQDLEHEKNTVKELEKSIQNLSAEIYEKDAEISNLQNTLDAIYQSKKWKIISKFGKLLNK